MNSLFLLIEQWICEMMQQKGGVAISLRNTCLSGRVRIKVDEIYRFLKQGLNILKCC